MASILIGALAGVVCAAAARAKFKLGYDDSLDVLAVHGMGGVVGMVLLGLLATRAVNPAGANGLLTGGGFHFFGLELLAAVVAIGFTFTVTWLLAKAVDLTIGLRVSREDEYSGLDLTQHAESAYSLGG
jgi:Amt family ammonium transporter